MRLAVHVFFGILLCASLYSVQGQVYLANNQAQATKMAPLVYYKPLPKDAPKVTTAEPSTETSQDNQGQYYINENYYPDYKSNVPPKYSSDYGQASSQEAQEGPTSSDYGNTTPPTPSGPADIQGHLDALLKLLLASKANSPKFLLLLPLTGKGPKPYPHDTPSPTTVKPKPRKKTKYIVVN